MVEQELQNSDYRIRKLIGTLGLLLPILLLLSQGELLSSISHYYYLTLASLLFIIILSSFGLFLLSYKGYKIDPTTEKVSDDIITNIGGLAALVVVFVPTRCAESSSTVIDAICYTGHFPLFGHNSMLMGTIHLVSAGIFILSMGWMSKYKFTRSKNDANIKLYRVCGNVVFIAIGFLIFLMILEKSNIPFWFEKYYVFFLETIAVISFGISWLIKGKVVEDMKAFKNRFKSQKA